mgnify:CR=1 FL=1
MLARGALGALAALTLMLLGGGPKWESHVTKVCTLAARAGLRRLVVGGRVGEAVPGSPGRLREPRMARLVSQVARKGLVLEEQWGRESDAARDERRDESGNPPND